MPFAILLDLWSSRPASKLLHGWFLLTLNIIPAKFFRLCVVYFLFIFRWCCNALILCRFGSCKRSGLIRAILIWLDAKRYPLPRCLPISPTKTHLYFSIIICRSLSSFCLCSFAAFSFCISSYLTMYSLLTLLTPSTLLLMNSTQIITHNQFKWHSTITHKCEFV